MCGSLLVQTISAELDKIGIINSIEGVYSIKIRGGSGNHYVLQYNNQNDQFALLTWNPIADVDRSYPDYWDEEIVHFSDPELLTKVLRWARGLL